MGWSRIHGKIPIFYIPYVFYRNLKALCQANFVSIYAKTVFWHKIGWKTKLLRFQNDFQVLLISCSGFLFNLKNYQNQWELFSRFISSSRGEKVEIWARGPKTQNFKVLYFKLNFRGRLYMTIKGTPWPNFLNKTLINGFMHDSSEESSFPRVLSPNNTGSSKFSLMASKFWELDSIPS